MVKGDIIAALANRNQIEALFLTFDGLDINDLSRCLRVSTTWNAVINSLIIPRLDCDAKATLKWVYNSGGQALKLNGLRGTNSVCGGGINADGGYVYWFKDRTVTIFKGRQRVGTVYRECKEVVSARNFFVVKLSRGPEKILIYSKDNLRSPCNVKHAYTTTPYGPQIYFHKVSEDLLLGALGLIHNGQEILKLDQDTGIFEPFYTVSLPNNVRQHWGGFSGSFSENYIVEEVRRDWVPTVIVYDRSKEDFIYSQKSTTYGDWYYPFCSGFFAGVVSFF